MPDFNELRTQLNQARKEKDQKQQALLISKEKLDKVIREKETLNRVYDQNKGIHQARKQQLLALEKETRAKIDVLKAEVSKVSKEEWGLFNEFAVFTDPRERIGMLSDSYPIFLLPVRIETRFKVLETAAVGERHQLWVRIYPDDCAIDTFEPIPSESELQNTGAYWSAFWQAGGHEGQERAAWRSLVASHGSGRASWLIKAYEPENKSEHPTKEHAQDIILVISVLDMPPAQDQQPILVFWKAYWQADGNKALQEQAFSQFASQVGTEKAANYLNTHQPDNLDQVPPLPYSKGDVQLDAIFLDFPILKKEETKNQSWTQAPKTNVLPDRFVLRGYKDNETVFEVVGNPVPSPLITGPDPSLDEEEQIKQENGEVLLNEDMRWLADFDEAIAKGMGFKISITKTQALDGFDKIIALGVRISADIKESTALVEELLEHHKNSRKGLSILPQGTPTNNTEKEGAGYKSLDDADESFDNLAKEKLFELTSDWLTKKDGQWLAESLGISDLTFQNMMNANATDQSEARAMNKALWPATLGYMMESLMQPVFSDQDIENTRDFFNALVLGRGTIPAIKIGKQPYGIYPATAFSKISWISGQRADDIITHATPGVAAGSFMVYLNQLYQVLKKIDADWTSAHLDKVSYIGKEGDAHQILLDAVGLTPQSVEFHQRYAESFEELLNRLSFYGSKEDIGAKIVSALYSYSGYELLKDLGYSGDEIPEILEKMFLREQNLLKGPLIDDVPLSEVNPIRAYTSAPDAHNYLRWLINAASTSHDTLRKQEGFTDDKVPNAMLYLLLHHALDLNFVDISLKLHIQAQILGADDVRKAKIEPAFLHVAENVKQSESKWQYLYKTDTRITEDFKGEIGAYIPKVMNTKIAAAYLKEQLEALKLLEKAPTARLERAFVEHLDLCTYRLDAWKNGIMNYQLAYMRKGDNDSEEEAYYKKGLHIGAYGILEDVRSENKLLTEKTSLDEGLEGTFLKKDDPLYADSTNGGYLAAPSLNHAVTAAILRNGYMENATSETPDLLSVNLSSARVRKALSVIEGIRAGQSLAELLGYQLERGLHDRYSNLELDFYIYELRRAFPLKANQLKDTQTDEDTPIEAVEARNVVDGLKLINHLKTLEVDAQYPYGKNLSEEGITQEIRNAIKAEVNQIQDINDAVSDVAIAESVHQVAQGNYDRGAATLDTYSKGTFPPIPDVIQTPRSGINITQRIGIQLESGVDHTVSPTAYPMTPRAIGEPALNKWLHTVLPDPDTIACKVVYFDYGSNSEKETVVTQEILKWQPIDLLYLLNMDMEQAIAQIDDAVIQYVRDHFNVRPDAEISIKYMEKIPGKISFFEVSSMVESLRSIVLNSRSLQAEDVARPTEDKAEEESVWVLNAQRIVVNRDALAVLKSNAEAVYTTISGFTEAETPDLTHIVSQVHSWADNVMDLLKMALAYGNPQASLGTIYDSKSGVFQSFMKKLEGIIARWNEKAIRYNDLMNTVAAATDEEKVEIMIRAEREISTASTDLTGITPAAYQAALNTKKISFDNKLNALVSLTKTTNTSVTTLYHDFKSELPLTDFDYEETDMSAFDHQIFLFAENLCQCVQVLSADLETRISKVDVYLSAHDAASESTKQVKALQDAGMAIFGEDFKMFHEFTLPEKQADEWENCFNDQAQLLDYCMVQKEIDFPVDDWLYGLARVREKMHHWENINFLNEAFEGSELNFQPIQLPYKANDHWLGLDYPEDYGKDEEDYAEGQEITKDKLLYTAYYATPFDKTKNQCGMLVDEWTELIPSKNETAGITFHFDRPNAEPPHVMLLAMPSDFRGEWQWEDLIDVINETLEMAKKRAIEPDHVDDSAYARFLPAVVSSTTTFPITASLNFAFNNNIQYTLNQNGD